MQGRLRGETVSGSIQSGCSACHASIAFTVDSDFGCRVDAGPGSPLVFQPSIDWATFRAPTIVNDY